MPGSRNSSAISSPKPVNIFYVWYAELCRRSNTTPLAVVKPAKPKSDSVLDFVADRIKAEEWSPILNALRSDTSLHVIAIRSRIQCKFLHDTDTEEKIKCMKRKFGTLWTAHILNCLVNSLTSCITRTTVLTCLELDGLPVISDYLQMLLEGLRKNKTIRILSLRHCPICDVGCQQLCNILRYMPNVEILNLTSCNLGLSSAEALAKVIRCQQINRYCESWHSSLRYEDPEVGDMAGLKRITLNNNPHIGDEGLQLILNELDDDLWIKAIDMQRCNITESIANRLVDVVDYSRSLEIADFRNNEQLCSTTIEKIFNILKSKQRFGYECEYQWCLSTTTLPYESSTYDLVSPSYTSSNIQKSKSAPFRQSDSSAACNHDFKLRRTKTFALINKKSINNPSIPSKKDVNLARKEVLELNAQLQQEINKRLHTEKQNVQLKERLKLFKSASKNFKPEESVDKLINVLQNGETSETDSDRKPTCLEIKMPTVSTISKRVTPMTSPITTTPKPKVPINQTPTRVPKTHARKPVEFVFPTNGSRLAQNLFENLIKRSGVQHEDSDEEDLLSLYCESGIEKPKEDPSKILAKIEEDDYESSGSNASLIRYVKEMHGEKSGHNGKVNGVSKENSNINGYKEKSVKTTEVNGFKKDRSHSTRRKTPESVDKMLLKVPPVR